LHEAVHARSLPQLRALLLEPVNLDAQDEHGRTALHHCSLCYEFALGALLVNHGASTDIRDHFGFTPIDLLFRHGDPLAPDSLGEPSSTTRH
jgi:ankyrin repeat protein